MSETLRKTAFYPIADRGPLARLVYQKTGEPPNANLRNYKARWTGEAREPKAGEWYLSGAKIECYRASSDLSTPYAIAEIVEVKTVTEYHVKRVL